MSAKARFTRKPRPVVRGLAVGLVVTLMLGGGGYAAINLWPDVGGQGADLLREALGDRAVAQLETAIFQTQDSANRLAYRLGAAQPGAPWAAPDGLAGATGGSAAHALLAPDLRPAPGAAPAPSAPLDPFATPGLQLAPPTPALAAPAEWALPTLPATGTIDGAGQWSAYLHDRTGRVVAYRAFLQPDPERPYAVAAVVAFDLQATRLHFVLGSDEPRSSIAVRRTGKIPAADLRPGVLLAAFNGGFKARHGHFGAMADGVTVLPPIEGFGTVAMDRDGQVRIGSWGADIKADPGLVAWRQNGPLIIQNGQINPHTADITSHDWGIILNGVTAVWRSGLGISADRRTLYYVAGNSLTLPALVRALADTGAAAALQLDINIGMVHFDAFAARPAGLAPDPLFAAMRSQQDDRFLAGDQRDYFYVTAAGG